MKKILQISHDLRTPVTHLVGYTDLFKSNVITCDEYVEIVARAATVLNAQIDMLIINERSVAKILKKNHAGLAEIMGYEEMEDFSE